MGCDQADDELLGPYRTVLGIKRTSGIAAALAHRNRNSIVADELALAVVPEIDHRVGEGLECVVDLTEAIEAKQ